MKRAFFTVLLASSSVVHAQFGGINLDPRSIDPTQILGGGKKIVTGASGVGTTEEQAIGGAVAVEIVSKYGGVWKNETATRRVNLIGKTLARYSDRSGQTWRFGILDSPSINAFSAPGNYVFITRGAYEAAANDNELAGLLAHEIIHVTRRHALRIISRNETVSGFFDVAGGVVTDVRTYDIGIDKVSQTLFKHGYDSGSEFDADSRGAKLAASAGFSRDGLLNFLSKIKDGGRPVFSTHPAIKDRLAKLSK